MTIEQMQQQNITQQTGSSSFLTELLESSQLNNCKEVIFNNLASNKYPALVQRIIHRTLISLEKNIEDIIYSDPKLNTDINSLREKWGTVGKLIENGCHDKLKILPCAKEYYLATENASDSTVMFIHDLSNMLIRYVTTETQKWQGHKLDLVIKLFPNIKQEIFDALCQKDGISSGEIAIKQILIDKIQERINISPSHIIKEISDCYHGASEFAKQMLQSPTKTLVKYASHMDWHSILFQFPTESKIINDSAKSALQLKTDGIFRKSTTTDGYDEYMSNILEVTYTLIKSIAYGLDINKAGIQLAMKMTHELANELCHSHASTSKLQGEIQMLAKMPNIQKTPSAVIVQQNIYEKHWSNFANNTISLAQLLVNGLSNNTSGNGFTYLMLKVLGEDTLSLQAKHFPETFKTILEMAKCPNEQSCGKDLINTTTKEVKKWLHEISNYKPEKLLNNMISHISGDYDTFYGYMMNNYNNDSVKFNQSFSGATALTYFQTMAKKIPFFGTSYNNLQFTKKIEPALKSILANLDVNTVYSQELSKKLQAIGHEMNWIPDHGLFTASKAKDYIEQKTLPAMKELIVYTQKGLLQLAVDNKWTNSIEKFSHTALEHWMNSCECSPSHYSDHNDNGNL